MEHGKNSVIFSFMFSAIDVGKDPSSILNFLVWLTFWWSAMFLHYVIQLEVKEYF